MMSSYEDEAFLREWEASEKSRHTRLLEEVKRECRLSTPAKVAVDLPYAVKIPRAVSQQQVKPQSRLPQMQEEQQS